MRKSAFKLLESQLIDLPYDQKKQLKNWLSDLIESQAESLIDATPESMCCRHCEYGSVKKWGKSDGLQRYKCKSECCGKTFNALTGTPLANLRHKDKWLDYFRCLQDSLPLRKVAERLGIDLTTAFRWRHRFLEMPTKNQPEHVSGIVEADETFFLDSMKGSRNIQHRKARKRGGQASKNVAKNKVSILIVRDRGGRVCDFIFDQLSKENIHNSLQPIIDKDSILCTDGSSWYKTFAKKEDISHHRLITLDNQRVIGKEFHIQNVNAYVSRLKTWMKRFNGVSTKYLSSYLGWRRLFEAGNSSQAQWLKLAMGYESNG